MALITSVPEPNIWDDICKDYASRRPPFDDDQLSIRTDKEDYDPTKFTPVLYGKMHAKVSTDINPSEDFDPALSHPACVGLAFVDRPAESPPPRPATPPDKKTSSPREYLEHYVFPILLPAMEEMLKQAKLEKCLERKRTKFNACDFLTEYLYRHNKNFKGREETKLLDIPFVQESLKEHPRPPLPMSLLWTEEEATLIIQSFWRGYKVRCNPEVQELRQWQREWREENENIAKKVNEFWDKQMPDGAEIDTLNVSTEKLVSRSAPTLIMPKEELSDEEKSAEQCRTDPEALTVNQEALELDKNDVSQESGYTMPEHKEEEISLHNASENISEQIPSVKENESNIEKKKELEVIT